jgi:phosphonopyruvate decarboxylase
LRESDARQAAPHARAVIETRGLAIGSRATRTAVLRAVVAHSSLDSAVLATTGFCGRELFAVNDRPNQLYMVGSMGCLLPLAIGLSLARPSLRVIALDGDGAALMRLGAFATAGAYAPANLKHLLLDNGVHDSTGGQATVAPQVSFGEIAAACGYASALETDDVSRLQGWLEDRRPGPHFARMLTKPGSPQDLPRPSMGPVEVKTRWQRHFGSLGHA